MQGPQEVTTMENNTYDGRTVEVPERLLRDVIIEMEGASSDLSLAADRLLEGGNADGAQERAERLTRKASELEDEARLRGLRSW